MLRISPVLVVLTALCACSSHAPSPGGTPVSTPAGVAAGPANAAVPGTGGTWPIALSPEQQAAVRAVAERSDARRRAHLRYALAQGDDGARRLVVYEASPKAPKARDYVVYAVLNAGDGSHYDPVQNELIAPIARER